jgi:hypothetical protein
MSASKPQYNRSKKLQTVVLPAETADARKAKHMPMFGPGLSIPVPLHLAPAYLTLYGLKPTGWREDGTLTVRRLTEDERGSR